MPLLGQIKKNEARPLVTLPWGTKHCDQRANTSACMYVHLLTYLKKHKILFFLHTLPVAMTRSSSDDSVIQYVLTVLRRTSCSHIMGHV